MTTPNTKGRPKGKNPTITQLNRVLPVPIELDNHIVDSNLYTNSSHITDVLVGDYHIIGGEKESGGGQSYVVWSIRIILDDATYSSIILYKRYSDIEKFRNKLINQFPDNNGDIPNLPPKDNFSLQRMLLAGQWLESRRKGLQWFMTNILLNPKYQKSSTVTDFILL